MKTDESNQDFSLSSNSRPDLSTILFRFCELDASLDDLAAGSSDWELSRALIASCGVVVEPVVVADAE
ncbi:MAG: hypothetical protein N2037_06665 [Acidimicrobiales bacterium]|nr:hypothetical protein [Acidimicrobiales bacterium]